jgi:adenylate cyclase 3
MFPNVSIKISLARLPYKMHIANRFCVLFGQILDQNKFKDIIKIKTIGSTYMASSGITESVKSEDGPRWGHLCTLVEFALELKKALSSINEQSFNHFVLKMGINHGPVTAGVIGARKPHYDIWGNTVNVASRMESTGKVGCIQVFKGYLLFFLLISLTNVFTSLT